MGERERELQELIDTFLKSVKDKQLTIAELGWTIEELKDQAEQLKIAE